MSTRRLAALAVAAVAASGCGGPDRPAEDDARVAAVLSGTRLLLEVADSDTERATGLMGRTEVPAGRGMLFRYPDLSEERFYMFRVPIPLRATFIREGRVVSTVVMAPCDRPEPQACPTYAAAGPYDTVVETDPAVAPFPRPGDAFVMEPRS